MFWLYKDRVEAWFCYCLYLEVKYGWNYISQNCFLRLTIKWVSPKRNCIRFGKQRQGSCHDFLKVSLVRCSEREMQRNEVIPDSLHSLLLWVPLFFPLGSPTDPQQPRLTTRHGDCSFPYTSLPFLHSLPLAATHILSQAPNLLRCFRRLASSLSLILHFPLFPQWFHLFLQWIPYYMVLGSAFRMESWLLTLIFLSTSRNYFWSL